MWLATEVQIRNKVSRICGVNEIPVGTTKVEHLWETWAEIHLAVLHIHGSNKFMRRRLHLIPDVYLSS